jgi:hypothetical protein
MAKKEQSQPFRLPRSPFVSPALKAGDIASGLLNKVFSDRGFTTREIITQWATIVGPELAQVTSPERLKWPRKTAMSASPDMQDAYESASLHIRVEGPIAIEVQHLAPQIIERINQFFGYPAIGSIRIIQAPVSIRGNSASATPGQSSPNKETGSVSEVPISGIADPDLAAALARLGNRVKGNNK